MASLSVLAAALVLAGLPASGWAAGELTQKAGTAGCVTFDGSEGCTTAPQVGRMAVISPDGEHIYTEAWETRSAIQIFKRDTATGVVTPLPGPTGCWQSTGAAGGCEVLGLTKPSGIAIDPDGENLYVSDFHTGTILTFDIDQTTGLLTKKTGTEGCMVVNGNGVTCANSPASSLAFHLVVSPDGKNLYAQSQQGGGAITTYNRDLGTGVLTVPVPADGACISNDGSEGGGFPATTCVDGRGLFVPEAIDIDDDGENVYVGSRERAVTVFDRNPTTGLLTQKAGIAGCWLATGAGAQADCQEGEFIDGGGGRFGLDVAPDGKSVYVATNDSLAVFQRDTGDGELSQPSEEFGGCVSSLGDPCFPSGSGMVGPQDVSVSPDNLQVYVATAAGGNSGVAVFDRDPATSLLTQKLGGDGCHTMSGGGGCTLARAMPASTVLSSPDGKNVYANNGGGAMAIFDRESPPPPGPGPGPGGGGGAGGGVQSTGGIGTQAATASSPGPATGGGRPNVGVQIVGRPQAGHYPYTASLLLTNYGKKDAVNATARIDGFHTGAAVSVLGGGATGTVLDDGASRSLLVTVEKVPARSSKVVLARFTPVGPGHSFYTLHASLMRSTAPGGVPKLTETRSVVTRTVTSGGGSASEAGTVSVTNTAGTATIPYKLEQTGSGPARTETKFKEAGGGLSVTVTAPQYAAATRPPNGSKAKRQGGVRLELSIDAAGLKVLGVDNPVWPMAGGIKLHYDELIDCMQRHGMLTPADQKRLKAMYTHQVLALIHTGRLLQSSSVPPSAEADAWAEQTIAVAASAVQAWEAEIVDSAKLDSAGGGKDKQKHIFIECSREERDGKEEVEEKEKDQPKEENGNDLPIEVITPDDPNAKYGPRGTGKAGFVPANRSMPYTIMFENKPTASAPAREVVVTDQLDGSKLDLATFALGPVWFGDRVLSPPPGLRAWSGSLDLRPAKPVIVTVDAKLDASGLATWHFKTIDPATQIFPEDPFAGFLPANNPPPIGEGAVTFTVAQRPNLKTATKISNAARIVFDKNEAIDTPVFTNTIDSSGPKVVLRKAKAIVPGGGKRPPARPRKSGGACRVALSWKGSDKGSGVGGYTVWVSARKKGGYAAVKRAYKRTRFTYKGKSGVPYRFRVVATDRAGNLGKGSKTLRASCPRR